MGGPCRVKVITGSVAAVMKKYVMMVIACTWGAPSAKPLLHLLPHAVLMGLTTGLGAVRARKLHRGVFQCLHLDEFAMLPLVWGSRPPIVKEGAVKARRVLPRRATVVGMVSPASNQNVFSDKPRSKKHPCNLSDDLVHSLLRP